MTANLYFISGKIKTIIIKLVIYLLMQIIRRKILMNYYLNLWIREFFGVNNDIYNNIDIYQILFFIIKIFI